MSRGVSGSTSTDGASTQAALNQFSNTVLPFPCGPTKTTLCGGAEPPTKSAKQRESTACCALRPASSGGAAPSPGANKRCSVGAMRVRICHAPLESKEPSPLATRGADAPAFERPFGGQRRGGPARGSTRLGWEFGAVRLAREVLMWAKPS